jgi:hypothetical protein
MISFVFMKSTRIAELIRRLAGPTFEGSDKIRGLRITERAGDFGKRKLGAFEQVFGKFSASLVGKMCKCLALLGQSPLKRTDTNVSQVSRMLKR